MIQTSLQGDKELTRKLKDIPDKTVNKGLRKGTRAGAKIVQAAAKGMVPQATGNLKRNIKVRAMKRKKGRVGARVTIPPDAFYGTFQEKGWKARNGRRIPGKYFMKTAANQEQSKVFQAITDGIKTAISEAVK